jgi:RNA polymerase sigma-70 factor (ECF subfamily)
VANRFKTAGWLEEERRCLRQLRAGNRAAFAPLYNAFSGPLYSRVLLPRLGDPRAAEDALAETFRIVLERLSEWHDQGVSIWFWLARIATNQAMDAHRAAARSERALAGYQRLLAPLLGEASAPPDEQEQREEEARVQAAVASTLGRIHPRYRDVLRRRFLLGHGREQCAQELGLRLGTFDVVLLRALRAFRREWMATFGEQATMGQEQSTEP